MTDWFTTEAIDNDTFVISEYKHWEETHCYLLIGTESALLIDTGLGVSDIKDVVGRYTSLPVIVATTHVHWDHIGGHGLFDDIAVHAAEVPWLSRFPLSREAVIRSLTCRPCAFPDGFDIARYRVFQGTPRRILRDGQPIDLGSRTVTAVHTPAFSGALLLLRGGQTIFIQRGSRLPGMPGRLLSVDESRRIHAFRREGEPSGRRQGIAGASFSGYSRFPGG